MASLSLYPQFETNLMSNRKVIKLLLQLKSAKAHGTKDIKVEPHLVRHLLRDRLLSRFAPPALPALTLIISSAPSPFLTGACMCNMKNLSFCSKLTHL